MSVQSARRRRRRRSAPSGQWLVRWRHAVEPAKTVRTDVFALDARFSHAKLLRRRARARNRTGRVDGLEAVAALHEHKAGGGERRDAVGLERHKIELRARATSERARARDPSNRRVSRSKATRG